MLPWLALVLALLKEKRSCRERAEAVARPEETTEHPPDATGCREGAMPEEKLK